ncbi:DUF1007 family protein [Pigmentiphaga soli]|uniref:DUF1007 family protein n=1 Tax=Pigmentiphaga soli TaxID=1007095 RepID=A0ABP8HEV2_9BURK
MFGLQALTRARRPALLLLGWAAAGAAWAHPHAWIDVRSTVVVSPAGMVAAIEEEWLFDELYTTYVVEEMAGGRAPTAEVAAGFAGQVIENLGPYGYFTKVAADGRPVALAPVTQYHSEMRGDRLVLRFTARLAQPVDPARHAFSYAIYDPTYFIEMKHDANSPPALRGSEPGRCRLDVRQPRPDPRAAARAFAMDRGAPADDTLGRLFAERVVMACR